MLGSSVAILGETNRDGIGEFAAGAPVADPGGVTDAGRIYLFSGIDGSTLFTIDGTASDQALGARVARIGDVNGDGKADLITSTTGSDCTTADNLVRVYSGADASLLLDVPTGAPLDNLGWSVAGIGDVTGDGVPDFAAGSARQCPGAGGANYVRAFSGSAGTALYSIGTGGYGLLASAGGDLNGDGFPDFYVGWCGGTVSARSGPTGAGLWSVSSPAPGCNDFSDWFGVSFANAGDVNADTVPDLIVGAPYCSTCTAVGYVKVFSGLDGSQIHAIGPGGGCCGNFGGAVAGAGDVDGDGRSDFLVADYRVNAAWYEYGVVFLYSGATAALLYDFSGNGLSGWFGSAIDSMVNANGAGLLEMILGAPLGSGHAKAYFVYGPTSGASFGSGCPTPGGLVPLATVGGPGPCLGEANFRLRVRNVNPGRPAVLVFGISTLPTPLNLAFIGMPPCDLLVQPLLTFARTTGGLYGINQAEVNLPIPPDPSLANAMVRTQWFVADLGTPFPGVVSQGFEVQILP